MGTHQRQPFVELRPSNQHLFKRMVLLIACACSGHAAAGGFALVEQGASGMGNAYAGGSALSIDASTVWTNPAGMMELGREFAVAGHIIAVDSEFTDEGTTLNAAFGLDPVPGTGDVDISGNTFLPNLYYTMPVRDNMAFGVGLSVPFGNGTEYGTDWVGRYQAVESSVSVIDINPALAIRVNDKLTVGAGISVQMLDAELGNSVDSSATCLGLYSLGAVSLVECATAGLASPGNPLTDGLALVSGDSTAAGFNLGLQFSPDENTRFGVAYRHGIAHEIDGDATFTTNQALRDLLDSKGMNLLTNTGAIAEIELPSTLSLSLTRTLSDKMTLLADATWTGWSSLPELRIQFDNPAQPDSATTLAWEDVWRVSAGINYQKNGKLTYRAGLAFDEEPITHPTTRTPRVPGNDRTWISFGVGYRFSQNVSADFGFSHLMLDETPIDNTSDSAGGTTTRGLYNTSINLFSAQLTWSIN